MVARRQIELSQACFVSQSTVQTLGQILCNSGVVGTALQAETYVTKKANLSKDRDAKLPV